MKNLLGNNIKLLREGRKWSQKMLGDRLGVKSQTISSWEIGRTEPNVDMLAKIGNLFNVDTRDLLWSDSLEEFYSSPEHYLTGTPAMDRLISALENMPEPAVSALTKEEQELLELWRNASLNQKMRVYNILSETE